MVLSGASGPYDVVVSLTGKPAAVTGASSGIGAGSRLITAMGTGKLQR